MLEHTPRILLVDDEQSIQTLLSFPLRKDGYEVVQATDGREALARFGETTFDLVVLDVMLPRMDGLEVCRRMRARSSVPIIMLTAKAEEIDKVLGLELGADDYITKPFSLREFRSRVKAALRRASMARREPSEGEEPLEVHELRIDPAKRAVEVRGAPVADDLRRVRDPRRPGHEPRARVDARHAAHAHLGRQRLPRPPHDRRAHPPPAREARARREGPGVPLHRARRGLPLPRYGELRSCARSPTASRCCSSPSRWWRSPASTSGVTSGLETGVRAKKLDTLTNVARQYSSPITDALDRSLDRKVLDARGAPGGRRLGRARDAAGRSRAGRQGLQTYVASDSTAAARDRRPAVRRRARGRAHRRVAPRHRGGQRRPRRRGGAAAVLTAPGRSSPASTTSPSTRRRWRTSTPPSRSSAERVLVAGGARAARRAAGRLPAGAGAQPPRPAPGARRRAASPRATSARASSRAPATSSASSRARWTTCSASSPSSKPRAQALHRHRLARAAHADLLARRLPGAARGRGARRGDAARPSCASCASRSTAWASWRPSCWTSRAWRPARSSCAPSRPTSATWPRRWPPSSPPRSPPTSRIWSSG